MAENDSKEKRLTPEAVARITTMADEILALEGCPLDDLIVREVINSLRREIAELRGEQADNNS